MAIFMALVSAGFEVYDMGLMHSVWGSRKLMSCSGRGAMRCGGVPGPLFVVKVATLHSLHRCAWPTCLKKLLLALASGVVGFCCPLSRERCE